MTERIFCEGGDDANANLHGVTAQSCEELEVNGVTVSGEMCIRDSIYAVFYLLLQSYNVQN